LDAVRGKSAAVEDILVFTASAVDGLSTLRFDGTARLLANGVSVAYLLPNA
jgi:hypothetical protein